MTSVIQAFKQGKLHHHHHHQVYVLVFPAFTPCSAIGFSPIISHFQKKLMQFKQQVPPKRRNKLTTLQAVIIQTAFNRTKPAVKFLNLTIWSFIWLWHKTLSAIQAQWHKPQLILSAEPFLCRWQRLCWTKLQYIYKILHNICNYEPQPNALLVYLCL